MRRQSMFLAVAMLVALGALGWAMRTQAGGGFEVNSTADAVDANPGDSACATSAGVCTLRAAIQEANALPGKETILLPAGAYRLTIPGAGEDAAVSGDLDITADLTIRGDMTNSSEVHTSIVDGGGLDRVFHVLAGASVDLEYLRIENGKPPGGGGGAGILNEGDLFLLRSKIIKNVSSGNGGGIENAGRLGTFASSVVENQAALGGGIYNRGVFDAMDTTLEGNIAHGEGGGIFNYSTGAIELRGSGVSLNVATDNYGGGGIFNQGSLTIEESKVFGNLADWSGGGIFNRGELSVLRSYIRENDSKGMGGGLYNAGDLVVEGGYVTENTALHGGGIAHVAGEMQLAKLSLSDNSAERGGGGLYNLGSAVLDEVEIARNVADLGAGVFNDFSTDLPFNEGSLNIERSNIDSNTATSLGGAVLNQVGVVSLHETRVRRNRANDGAGLVNIGGELRASFVTVEQNEAEGLGGGVVNASGSAMFDNLTVRDNKASYGGGVYNYLGSLEVRIGDVTGNMAMEGGGVYNSSGDVLIVDTTIRANSASEMGGGAFSYGYLSLLASTVTSNQAKLGGGIYVASRIQPLHIPSEEISGATGDSAARRTESQPRGIARPDVPQGGGLEAAAVFDTSTLEGNQASAKGGALYSEDASLFTSSTIADNSAPLGFAVYTESVVAFHNTIVAHAGAGGRNCEGPGRIDSWGHNLETSHTCGFSAPGDLRNTDPLLGPLQDNGGRTHTMALGPGSPAIDAGDDEACTGDLDQRNEPRHVDGDGDGRAVCDIGAFEAPEPDGTFFVDVPPSHPLYRYIKALYEAGFTTGCSLNPLMYCPDEGLKRSHMAVFMERAEHGASYVPPMPDPNQLTFEDVPISHWVVEWVEGLWRDQYTEGCQIEPKRLFCPERDHTKAEASVFGLRMMFGRDYRPPNATPYFIDVAPEAWYFDWVHAAYNAGLLPACSDPNSISPAPRFCPDEVLDRGWAAYMIVVAKGLLPVEGTPTPTASPSPTSTTPTPSSTIEPTATPTTTETQPTPTPSGTLGPSSTPTPPTPSPSEPPTTAPPGG